MRVLLDCDGVLADCIPYLFKRIGADFGPVDNWDFLKFLEGEQKTRATQLMKEPVFWAFLPLIEGAQEGVKRIEDAGHEIHYVTSEWKSCSGWGNARRYWLKENFGADPSRVHISDSKHIISGDVFVDDKPEHILSWDVEQGGGFRTSAILMDSHHNQNFDWAHRFDWSKLLSDPFKTLFFGPPW